MLCLYGCEITSEDAGRLVAALTDSGSHASLEAAAAIRWGAATGATVSELEPELRTAVLAALESPPPGLVQLRGALVGAATPTGSGTRIVRRLHNPRRRACGCLSDCWCRRTTWGRVLRWYVPARHHRSVSPCWKCAGDEPAAQRP